MKKLFAILMLVAFVGAYAAPVIAMNETVAKVVVDQDKDKDKNKKASKKEVKAEKAEKAGACCTEAKKETVGCHTGVACTSTCGEKKESSKGEEKK
jgi:hypothetical protein